METRRDFLGGLLAALSATAGWLTGRRGRPEPAWGGVVTEACPETRSDLCGSVEADQVTLSVTAAEAGPAAVHTVFLGIAAEGLKIDYSQPIRKISAPYSELSADVQVRFDEVRPDGSYDHGAWTTVRGQLTEGARVRYQVGRAQGRGSVAALTAHKDTVNSLLRAWGDVTNKCDLHIRFDDEAGGRTFVAKHCVLTSFTGAVESGDMMIIQGPEFLFAGLEFLGQGDVLRPAVPNSVVSVDPANWAVLPLPVEYKQLGGG
jgi:hypothetical protein